MNALDRMTGFRLVTTNLPRLVQFYSDVLGFLIEGPIQVIGQEEMALLTPGGGGRRQCLRVGEQIVAIDEFEMASAPYPSQTDAASLSFQHLALVVANIEAAYGRLAQVSPISVNGPQQLPPSSGRVTAFKFRDPDGHPLELLQFPKGGGPERWSNRMPDPGCIAIGIDHSAISVADLDRSQQFYADLGLDRGARTFNTGKEQQRLDGLADAEVDVMAMNPRGNTPHLELLAYHISHGQQPGPLRINNVAATRIVWQGSQPGLFADPDGHWHQIES